MSYTRTITDKYRCTRKSCLPTIIPVIAFLLGFVGSSVFFQYFRSLYAADIEVRFRNDASRQAQLVTSSMRRRTGEIATLGRFFTGSDFVSQEEFAVFTRPWQETDEFMAIYWVPEDPEEESYIEYGRQAHVATLQSIIKSSSFFIVEKSLKEKPGELVSISSSDGQNAYEIIGLAVIKDDAFLGSLYAFIDYHDLIIKELGHGTTMRINLKDVSQAGNPILHNHHGILDELKDWDNSISDYVFLTYFDLAGHKLLLEFMPGSHYPIRQDYASWVIFLGGIFLSSILAIFARVLIKGMGTARHQAELIQIELQGFFDTSLDMFAISSIDGVFMRVNPQWENTLGWSVEFLEGSRFYDYIHPDDIEATQNHINNLKGRVEPLGIKNRYRTVGGEWRNLEWRSILSPDGKTIYAAARDITERQKLEKKINRSLAEKEALLKEIHHRVKNNLQIVSSMLNLQTIKHADPLFVSAVEEAQTRIRTMALIHEQLYQQGNFAAIDFSIYADELVSTLIRDFSQKPIAMSVDIKDFKLELSSAISCGLILNELITNAIKYGTKDEAKAKISVDAFAEMGEYVLRVSDQGPGIGKDAFENDSSSLGLSLVKGLSHQLGGTARLLDAPGTSIEIRFPIQNGEVIEE